VSLLGAAGSIVQRSGPAPQRPQFTSTKTQCKRHITKINAKINAKRHQDNIKTYQAQPNPTCHLLALSAGWAAFLHSSPRCKAPCEFSDVDSVDSVDMDISAGLLLGKSLRTAPCSRWANGNVPWTWQTSFSSDLKACNGHNRRQALRLRLCRIPLAKHVHQARLWD